MEPYRLFKKHNSNPPPVDFYVCRSNSLISFEMTVISTIAVSLILISTFSYWQVAGNDYSNTKLHARAGTGHTSYYIATSGTLGCPRDQVLIDFLGARINEARLLAEAASAALNIPGSENSYSFDWWFGSCRS